MSEIVDLYNESYHNNFKNIVKENEKLKAENDKLKKIIRKSAEGFCNDYLETFEKLDKIKEIIITGNCLECDDELYTNTNLTCEEIRFNKIKELIINNNGQHI